MVRYTIFPKLINKNKKKLLQNKLTRYLAFWHCLRNKLLNEKSFNFIRRNKSSKY